MLTQRVRRIGATKAANIVRRGDHQGCRTAQRPGYVGLRQQLATTVANGNIKPFAGERHQPIGHLQLQMKLRVLMQKRRDGRNQLLSRERHRRGKAQRSAQRAALIVAGAGKNLADLPKRFV